MYGHRSDLGAAFLAGLAVGLWVDPAKIEDRVPPHDCFDPQMSTERREALYAGLGDAVARTTLDPGV